MDECFEGMDNCNNEAHCINNIGGFHCKCKSGFLGDGVQCQGLIYYYFVIKKPLSIVLIAFKKTFLFLL